MFWDVTQQYAPGWLTLICAGLFSLLALWGYSDLAAGDVSARRFARRAYGFFALSIGLASLVLVWSLLQRDFRLQYVHDYSGLDLPTHFQFSAFWAGQAGSYMIWTLFAAVIGILLARTAGRHEAPVMMVYILTVLSLVVMLYRCQPFKLLTETPVDGKGLNPLLQDPWMVIHPPIMFVGYALSAVPFAFAFAALWKKDTSEWAKRAFPWALAGFLVLGVAILLGGFWAYKTLGWGGYWGWDPVENASLIPWLVGVALIHGLYLERTRRRFRRANIVLAILMFLSVIYGTFLTRSGVLADFSVHSFVDLGTAGWLLTLLLFWTGLSALLLVVRLGGVKTEKNEDELLSRGAFLVIASVVVLLSAVVVTAGTSAPILTRFFTDPQPIGPSFYNKVNFPLALIVALALATVPFLTWRAAEPREVLRKLVPAAILAALATVIAAILARGQEPMYLLFVFLGVLAASTNAQRMIQLARAGGLRVAGGYLAHAGVGVILVGILASSAYDSSTKVTLVQNQARDMGDLRLTFQRFVDRGQLPDECGNRECLEVEVAKADGSSYLAYPRMFINDRTRQMMQNPHIRTYLSHDLYISPIEFDPGVAAGGLVPVRLVKDEAARVGELEVRFLGYDLNVEGDALAHLQSGGRVTIGAALAVRRGDQAYELTPVYRFLPNQEPDTPPVRIPGGGSVSFTGLTPSEGAVFLTLAGVPGIEAKPASISIDVTKKPLILLVWVGIGIILVGGLVAMFHRIGETKKLEPA